MISKCPFCLFLKLKKYKMYSKIIINKKRDNLILRK